MPAIQVEQLQSGTQTTDYRKVTLANFKTWTAHFMQDVPKPVPQLVTSGGVTGGPLGRGALKPRRLVGFSESRVDLVVRVADYRVGLGALQTFNGCRDLLS